MEILTVVESGLVDSCNKIRVYYLCIYKIQFTETETLNFKPSDKFENNIMPINENCLSIRH